ncbi:P-loop containing nucleoside triphosphate hydrolase protein [Microthyrium microscopicum]|uniref:Origin recognition complex subunit 1 n=1 Tax=Microthyrium microscopicum TaxID=703497 RepID=A0A6A6U6L1_9PEZI|nr:P-loop containing nucleoside triphosphate hydrolase protein [Microthyrium microscopicum]
MPGRKESNLQKARRWLSGGAVTREDSDDELGEEDLPWEWIHAKTSEKQSGSKKRKRGQSVEEPEIIGARMGTFECKVGDTVFLKSSDNQAWIGIICEFTEDEDGDKCANFMWFSAPDEIRNKTKKRTDFYKNELYISPSYDVNPLSSINGTSYIMSPGVYNKRFPKGTVPRNAKEYGKVFICRRGCNTRTATYTEEFVWEKIYKGEQDIPALVELVNGQTKATRKRSGPRTKQPKDEDDQDDYMAGQSDPEQGLPHTPRKKRKFNDAITPKSHHKTPASRKFLTPTHKRIVIKKALEITPLGTRILSPSVLASPYALARNHLHVSSVPTALPCREEEFAEVYTHLESAITAGTGSCIYIAGTPGTGKTATVREVVAQLNAAVIAEELDDFIFVEINGMKVTDPHQSYSLLWEALRGDRVSPSHALDLLEREFSTPSPRRVPVVVLMDELDQLVTKNQSVMYNFFNWPGLRHSRLIVLAVANTMDLPERTLSNKISSRLGLHRITFRGYTHAQLIQIIESRLANVPNNIVHPDAIQFASRKVAAVSGDARRALDICRRAVEIAEAQAFVAGGAEDETPNSPSKSARGKNAAARREARKSPIVTIATIKEAIAEATSSPLQQYLRSLPLASKVFLAALLARNRRTGVAEALVGDVLDEARRMGVLSELTALRQVLLGERQDGEVSRKGKGKALASRMVGMEGAVVCLTEAGIVAAETRKGERGRRVRLNVGDEEVGLALKDDVEVRNLGFN